MGARPPSATILAVGATCVVALGVLAVMGVGQSPPPAPSPSPAAAAPVAPSDSARPPASFERFGPLDLAAPAESPAPLDQQMALAFSLPLESLAPEGDLAPRAPDGGAMRLAPRHGGLAVATPPAPADTPATAPGADESNSGLPAEILSIRPSNFNEEIAAFLRENRVAGPSVSFTRIASEAIWVFRGAEYRWVVCLEAGAPGDPRTPVRAFEAVYLSGRIAGVVADDAGRCAQVPLTAFPEGAAATTSAPTNRRPARERSG